MGHKGRLRMDSTPGLIAVLKTSIWLNKVVTTAIIWPIRNFLDRGERRTDRRTPLFLQDGTFIAIALNVGKVPGERSILDPCEFTLVPSSVPGSRTGGRWKDQEQRGHDTGCIILTVVIMVCRLDLPFPITGWVIPTEYIIHLYGN